MDMAKKNRAIPFEINKDIKIVINKCDELLMRSEGSTDPKLKREILDLREKFLNGEKDISRKIFGNKEVSDLINSKKLSDKLFRIISWMCIIYLKELIVNSIVFLKKWTCMRCMMHLSLYGLNHLSLNHLH